MHASLYYLGRFLLLLGAAGTAAAAAQTVKGAAGKVEWQHEFDHPVQFQSILNQDLLVVGTSRHLYGIRPRSGEILWRKRNLSVATTDLTVVQDESYLLINDAGGGAFADQSTNVLAIGQQQGEILWESSVIEGKVLQATLDPYGDTAFIASVKGAHGDDRGFLSAALPNKGFRSGFKREPHISALNVSTGKVLWTQSFGKKVSMSPAYRATLDDDAEWLFTRPFDLSLFHPPVVADSKICVTYYGIRCYERTTGALAWDKSFAVLNDDLALSYAYPLVRDGVLITSGTRRVYAFDILSGRQLWRSRRFSMISDLIDPGGEILFAQQGGHFFDIKKERWVWQGDFGVIALNRNTGKTQWRYKKVKGSITNLLLLEHQIWLADERRLICLNRHDGSLCLRTRHNLEKRPVMIGLNNGDKITLIGESEAASFAPVAGNRLWHTNYTQPGPGAWRRFSRSMINASGNALRFGSFVVGHAGGFIPSLAVPVAGVNVKLLSGKKLVKKSTGKLGRQITADGYTNEDSGLKKVTPTGYQYFVIQPEGSERHALVVINLANGRTESQVALNSETPNVAIDEANGLIYAIDDKILSAVPIYAGKNLSSNAL